MMPRIIILLGPDKAGKSTLCNSLLKEYPWYSYRKGLKPDGPEAAKQMVRDFLTSVNQTIDPIICDRFHYPDELIYSYLNRNSDLSNIDKQWYESFVLDWLKRLDAVFIYCFADTDVLVKRFQESGETDIKAEWLKLLKTEYDTWVSGHQVDFSILRLNSSKLTQAEMVTCSKKFLNPVRGV